MKKVLSIALLFLGFITIPAISWALGSANNDLQYTRDVVLNADDESGDVAIKFGNTLSEYLQWNDTSDLFELSDALITSGSITTGVNGLDGSLTIYSEQDATDYAVIFNPHAAMTATTTYTLPADDGTDSQVLSTDGSGALSWATAGSDADTTSKFGIIDGLSFQKATLTIVSSGGLQFEVEAVGGGDIDYMIDGVKSTLDCTTGGGTGGIARVALTAGSDANTPATNYVYVTDSGGTATLVASTSIPTGAFAWVGKVVVPDATTWGTTGAYSFQRYTESFQNDSRGALSHEREKLRSLGATYISGVGHTLNITSNGGAADNVHLATGSGSIYQLHRQSFPAFTTGPYYYGNGPNQYERITDLNAALATSTGESLSGRRFNLVIWGAVNITTGESKLFVNLPTDSYYRDDQAIEDRNNYSDYTVPDEMRSVGFLISRLALRHTTTSSGTWSELGTYSLLGNPVGTRSGGTGAVASNTFVDSQFLLYDDGDDTKELAFQTSGITTGTKRTLTAPDYDGTIATVAGIETLTNKTLTSPTIGTSPTAVGATWTDLGIVTTADINGGSIDGTTLGATTPSSGIFTTLQAGSNGADGQISIYSEQGTPDYSVVFQPHAAMTQTTTYTLPANDGDASQFLTTDGGGVLSWAAGGGSSSTQIIDADSDTKIQVEESADEDKIRFDTAGVERAVLDSTGLTMSVPILLEQSTTLPATAGAINFDAVHSTLNVRNIFSGSSLQVGQEEVRFVINNTGSTINTGELVYISGYDATADALEITKAIADITDNAYVDGMVTTTMVDGATGLMTLSGRVNDLDTSGYTAGDILYLSSTVAGGVTNVQPPIGLEIGNAGKINASTGFINVHLKDYIPEIFGSFSHDADQSYTADVTGTVAFNTNDFLSGMTHSTTVNNSEITIDSSGIYQVEFRTHITRSASAGVDDIAIFYAIDTGAGFVNVAGSAAKYSITEPGEDKTGTHISIIRFNAGDKIQYKAQTEDAGLILDAIAASGTSPNDIPLTPSVVLNIVRLAD